MNIPPWDERDMELDLRRKFAELVAIKTSGIENAIPEQDDYDLADKAATLINNEIFGD
jgi:hypothetical protein